MNSALLKEWERGKRAMAVPVVENRKRKVEEPAKVEEPLKPVSTEKVQIEYYHAIDNFSVTSFH